MKKLLLIPFLFFVVLSFGQRSRVLAGFYPNGMPGLKIPDTITNLYVDTNYLANTNDSTIAVKGSKLVTDVTLNATADSAYIYKGGILSRVISIGSGGSGGAAVAAGSTTQVQYNLGGAFSGSAKFRYDSSLFVTGGKFYYTGEQAQITVSAESSNSATAIQYKNPAITTRSWYTRGLTNGSFDIISMKPGVIPSSLFIIDTLGNIGIQSLAPTSPLTVGSTNPRIELGQNTGYYIQGASALVMATNRDDNTGVIRSASLPTNRIILNSASGDGSIDFWTTNTNGGIYKRVLKIDVSGMIYYTNTVTPVTPAAGNVVEWWDGTNKRWKKSDGSTGIIY